MKLDVKTVIILVALLITATIGSAYVTSWVFSHRDPVAMMPVAGLAPDESSNDDEWNDQLVWVAGSFTVNLASSGSTSNYIKTSMSFRVNEQETIEEMERRRVQISDRIITILRTTAKSDLDTEEGISQLKQRMIDGINELIVDDGGRAFAVYFSELVIQ